MLCTGNAARSVMAGRFLEEAIPDAAVVTAGTHVVEHQPMSSRTREALAGRGVDPGNHRSHQLTPADVADADLIVAMSPEHIRYVRRHHPQAASRIATLPYLAEKLPDGAGSLAERVASLSLADVDSESQGEVPDPAGRDQPVYVEVADQIADLIDKLAPRVRT